MSQDADLSTIARRAIVCLDLTNLDDGCTEADIETLCARAQTKHGSTAAVCVWPRFVAPAARLLKGTGIKVATVVNFPDGDEEIDAVIDLAKAALSDGAAEIDMVVPYTEVSAGNPAAVEESVAALRDACPDALLKAILETGRLKSPYLIRDAAERALAGGADFLKTSTGKVSVNATPEAAAEMLKAIRMSGGNAGLKVAGGIRSTEDAKVYFDLCDEMMGGSWAGPRNFRIGASGLLDALLATLGGAETAFSDSDY